MANGDAFMVKIVGAVPHAPLSARRGAGRPGSWTDAESSYPTGRVVGKPGRSCQSPQGNSRIRGEPATKDSRPDARLAWRRERGGANTKRQAACGPG